MQIKPINNEPIVKRVYDTLCELIFSGQLKPGDKIPTENELAGQFGVGRNSIREAKKMLLAIGVFKEVRGFGTFVEDKITPAMFNPLLFSMLIESKDSNDVYELRIMFEVASIQLALEKASDEELESVKEVLDRTIELYANGERDYNIFIQHDIDFHSKIYELTKNPLIQRIGKTINELFRQFMIKSIQQTKGIERSLENHKRIIDLLIKRNVKDIKKEVEKTLEEWKEKWA